MHVLNSCRFVLANTTELHEKIGQLSNRVRELELALRDSHILSHPSEQHPLLRDDLLQIKRPLEREPTLTTQPEEKTESVDNITAIGSLYVNDYISLD